MIAHYQEHGTANMHTRFPDLEDRSQEVQSINFEVQTTTKTDYPLGSVPSADYLNMRIVERSVRPDGPVWQLRLAAEGIADDRTSIILAHDEDLPSRGWDVVQRQIYTSTPNAAHYLKGGQIMDTPRTGVSGEADDEVFTKVAHGLVSGQLADLTFASGFGGCTSGTRYLIQRLGADTLMLANAAQTKYITGVASTNVITSTAHGMNDGDPVTCPILKGGAGLTVFTVYYVRDKTTDTLKLAATAGGAAIDFTTDIVSYSTLVPLIKLSSDGTDGTLTPVVLGYERLWITDRRKSKARGCLEAEALGLTGYYHLDLQLMGLNQVAGEVKLPVRTISATAQALDVQDFSAAIINAGVYSGPDDDNLTYAGSTAYTLENKVAFDLPQAAVTITYISPNSPPTWMLGTGIQWVPTDAPSVSVIGLYGSADTIHFPSGWRLMNVQSEQLPGQSLYLTTVTIGYQRATTPGE